jgi:formyltetrahydrofolate-dependent phosphoribosylglycinamide formyltransferase
MLAIAIACQTGELSAQMQVVISPVADSSAVIKAKELNLHVKVVSPASNDYANELLSSLKGCDLLCLAGYMRLLPVEVLKAFPSRILNIHPALLPKFGGKGMYGHHVHQAVIEAGETESGCTVHFVSERYDEGEIILQRRCQVFPNESADTLAARVLIEEHLAYPEAIRKVIETL